MLHKELRKLQVSFLFYFVLFQDSSYYNMIACLMVETLFQIV